MPHGGNGACPKTFRVFDLLLYLQNRDRVVGNDELFDKVWDVESRKADERGVRRCSFIFQIICSIQIAASYAEAKIGLPSNRRCLTCWSISWRTAIASSVRMI
jgi:hypothetical protein